MTRYVLLSGALLLAGLTSTGCQKPPIEETTGAQQALSTAQGAEALDYAPSELEAANDALAAAQAEIEAQNQRFAMVRDYDHAKELLAAAVTQADTAREAAATAKAQAKADAEAALADLTTSFEGATADLTALASCAKKPKGFAADLEALGGRLDALAAEVAPIQETLDKQAFRDATAAAGTLSTSLSALSADLQLAREKLGC